MRKTLIILISIAVVITGVLLYLKYRKSRDLEPLIKERLSNLVKEASQGLYRLDIGNMEIDILKSRLVLVQAHLVPDTLLYSKLEEQRQAPNDIFDIYVDKISIDDIDVAALTANRDINLRKLFIDLPIVKVWHRKQSYNKPPDSTKTLYELISKDVGRIKVDTMLLRDVNFTYYNRKANNKPVHFEKVNFIFTDLLMDSITQYDQSRFLYAKDCRIGLKNYTLNTANGLYGLTAASLEIRTRDKVMELEKIRLRPNVSYDGFYARVKHQQDIFNLDANKLRFNQVAWWSLLAEESFMANNIELKGGSIKVYNDKSQTPDMRSKLGKFPHQLLAKVNFNILVDTVKISDLTVSYEELNPNSNRTGTVFFQNVSGVMTNITNNQERIRANSEWRVDADALFLGQAPLKASFIFDLNHIKNGNFSVQASIGALQQDRLNDILMPLALVKVNKVNVKSLDVSIHGDNYRASGMVKMLYNDLNVTALRLKGDSLKERALFSFIANNFVLKKDNPIPGDAPRTEQGVHEHDPTRSFFNLVWKTIFSGAGKTVGYNKKQ